MFLFKALLSRQITQVIYLLVSHSPLFCLLPKTLNSLIHFPQILQVSEGQLGDFNTFLFIDGSVFLTVIQFISRFHYHFSVQYPLSKQSHLGSIKMIQSVMYLSSASAFDHVVLGSLQAAQLLSVILGMYSCCCIFVLSFPFADP